MSTPFVSIIMRSFNEGWALKETLPALRAQRFQNWELIIIDSGSTDGSVDLARAANPAHFVQIGSGDYNPSKVMNQGMQLARATFGVFLNADATPQGDNWLRPLVDAFSDSDVAAVFSRQIPRPGCQAVFACDYDRCFGPQRESAEWDHFFSMVSSGIRKNVWAQRGFREDLQYAEDDEFTRWCKRQGYKVSFCSQSVVMHSHNYTLEQAYRRSFGDARALAATWEGRSNDFNWLHTVALGWTRDFLKDIRFCRETGRAGELTHAARVRWQQRLGRLAGFQQGWKDYRS